MYTLVWQCLVAEVVLKRPHHIGGDLFVLARLELV